MGDVLTMNGTPLQTPEKLAEALVKECEEGKVESFIAVIETPDGYSRVWMTRQTHGSIVFAAAVLNAHAQEIAAGATLDEDGS